MQRSQMLQMRLISKSSQLDLQATEAEQKEDREILCGEIFSDVTGELDELAQGRLMLHY